MNPNDINFTLNIEGEKRTITINQNITFETIIDQLERLFPGGEWKKFEIVPRVEYMSGTTTPWWPCPYTPNPITDPIITWCCGDSGQPVINGTNSINITEDGTYAVTNSF